MFSVKREKEKLKYAFNQVSEEVKEIITDVKNKTDYGVPIENEELEANYHKTRISDFLDDLNSDALEHSYYFKLAAKELINKCKGEESILIDKNGEELDLLSIKDDKFSFTDSLDKIKEVSTNSFLFIKDKMKELSENFAEKNKYNLSKERHTDNSINDFVKEKLKNTIDIKSTPEYIKSFEAYDTLKTMVNDNSEIFKTNFDKANALDTISDFSFQATKYLGNHSPILGDNTLTTTAKQLSFDLKNGEIINAEDFAENFALEQLKNKKLNQIEVLNKDEISNLKTEVSEVYCDKFKTSLNNAIEHHKGTIDSIEYRNILAFDEAADIVKKYMENSVNNKENITELIEKRDNAKEPEMVDYVLSNQVFKSDKSDNSFTFANVEHLNVFFKNEGHIVGKGEIDTTLERFKDVSLSKEERIDFSQAKNIVESFMNSDINDVENQRKFFDNISNANNQDMVEYVFKQQTFNSDNSEKEYSFSSIDHFQHAINAGTSFNEHSFNEDVIIKDYKDEISKTYEKTAEVKDNIEFSFFI